jgi:methylthioribose-1-phosphate isomerase
VTDDLPPPVEWHDGAVRLLDQRALPHSVCFIDCRTVDELCDAITTLAVRGAPALGAAGAYGVALAAHAYTSPAEVYAAAAQLARARPTAVNLAWGVAQSIEGFERGGASGALAAAVALAAADIEANEAIGRYGVSLIPAVDGGARVLTHCNAGHLATAGYGTALGIIRAGYEAGRIAHVWVDETRPVLQGARLTAWELQTLGIPSTLVVDAAAGSLMAAGKVDLVVVGADRVAANGDVANKIGTYGLAVLARHHGIPFVVAAPWSTVDLATPDGQSIAVEARDGDEITHIAGTLISPVGFSAYNPAFDVTPAELITAIVTEQGVMETPITNQR